MKSSLKSYQKTLPSNMKAKKKDDKTKVTPSKKTKEKETPKSTVVQSIGPEILTEPAEEPRTALVKETDSNQGMHFEVLAIGNHYFVAC